MAKKNPKARPPIRTIEEKVTEVRMPGEKRKPTQKARTRKENETPKTELKPMLAKAQSLLPTDKRESLMAWFNLYMGIEAAGAENTRLAKKRDLESFLTFLFRAAGTDHPDQWTRSLTEDFLKYLQKKEKKSATTVNRVLATLKHAAKWVHLQRPFLAGPPTDRIGELVTDDPEWKGLKDIEVTRLRSAAEQLLHIKTRKNQQSVRDYAIFTVLLHTGLRVSELLSLELSQYNGKSFQNVRRKGKRVSRQVTLTSRAREALDAYLEVRGKVAGSLFTSKAGNGLARQNVDEALKAIASQANSTLPTSEHIELSAHTLRHTMLRRAAVKHGLQYAKELSGHASDRYIWRYVQPSEDEKEAALEELF